MFRDAIVNLPNSQVTAMSQPKIAIIFYSTYGTNRQVALTTAEAAQEAGANVRLLQVAKQLQPLL